MKTLKIGDSVFLTVQALGKTGEGIAEYDGKPIFIENALPDESIYAKIIEIRKNYYRAEIISIAKESPDRDKPICSLFGRCGGCQIMHMQYSAQLELKRQRVKKAFDQFSLVTKIEPCQPSPLSLGYRNKIQLPVQGTKIGLYAKASHEIIELDSCPVHCALGESVFQKIKSLLLPVQHILIKTSIHQEQVLVTLIAKESQSKTLKEIASAIMASSPSIKGVVLNVNKQESNVILGNEYHLLAGDPYIIENLGGRLFRISAASFFQVNTLQAERMYARALEICRPKANEIVLDAFCGVGTFSLYFANYVQKAIGIECVAEAIEDAKTNALLNGIENAFFYEGLAEEFIKNCDPIDILILNPPRKGCAFSMLQAIKNLQPPKILYISCDPETLARDLSYLTSIGYLLETVQPIDMFPQTMHVETLTLLKKSL